MPGQKCFPLQETLTVDGNRLTFLKQGCAEFVLPSDSTKRKTAMPKTRTARREYPKETIGSKLAAEVRNKCNGLTDSKRAELFNKGMALIYGGSSKQAARAGR